MSEGEKDDSSLIESQENVEQNDSGFDNNTDGKIEIKKSQSVHYQQKIDVLNEQLEKEKKNSALVTDKWKRALADYQNLEKQTIDRINAREDKIILYFLTVHEDFIRAKNAYKKEGGNVDSLNSIIKNMGSILDHYEVKPIEAEGKKLDPKLHEVVQEIEDNNHEEGTIVKEIAKGYIIRGEVIKYSKVCVSKKIIKE